MPADPNPLLSTMVGASAGLVAIVGGLLVASYLALDSEQQGADRLLADAKIRLLKARDRVDEAAGGLMNHEVSELLGNVEVVDAIFRGETKALDLVGYVDMRVETDYERITLCIRDIREFAHELRDDLRSMLPTDRHSSWWAGTDAEDLKRTLGRQLGHYPLIWDKVFDEVAKERRRAAEEAERAQVDRTPNWSAFAIKLGDFSTVRAHRIESSSGFPDLSPIAARADHRALITNLDRARQRVEDLELEVDRLQSNRMAVVKPNHQLWIGLLVLAFPTTVGVVLPVLKMSAAPTEFDGQVKTLVVLFILGLAVVMGYLSTFAIRLLRRGRKADLPEIGSD